jgi:hypothetical protein
VLARHFLPGLLISLLLVTSCSKPPAKINTEAAKSDSTTTSSSSGAPAKTAGESKPDSSEASKANPTSAAGTTRAASTSQTKVLMHNVILNERPGFKLRVRWVRGVMRAARPGVVPSFDEPNSFVVDIQDGVTATSLADISGLLNGGLLEGMPLSNVSLAAQGKQLKLNGTLHKGLPLPVEMISDVGVSPDGLIRLHVVKLRVLKVPVKALMQSLHITVADVFKAKGATGIQISGEDILLDAQQILPAPAIRGKVTDAHLGNKTGDLITVFGTARPEVVRVRQWHNFIRLLGGTVNFGKLTMTQTDLILIDPSKDEWFNFDLTRYQEQLVNGRIQMTPEAGLQIFMPDIDKIPRNAANQDISLEWLKHRNLPPPADDEP